MSDEFCFCPIHKTPMTRLECEELCCYMCPDEMFSSVFHDDQTEEVTDAD